MDYHQISLVILVTALLIIDYLEYKEKPTKIRKFILYVWSVIAVVIYYGLIRSQM